MRQPPILITASLNPGKTPQVALSNVPERTLRHMEGLLAWLKEPFVERLVFAKNCNLPVRSEVLLKVAARYGKDLEFVQVNSSPRTAIQGKGYGEGDLIRQALGKSEILRSSKEFLKITGKLFMPKAAEVFSGEVRGEFFVSTGCSAGSVFPTRRLLAPAYRNVSTGRGLALLRRCRVPWGLLAASPAGWIDTRCYRVVVDFYRERFSRSHERVQDALGYTLENAVYDDLGGAADIRRMTTPPVIIGTSGTLGTVAGEFSEEIRREAEEMTRWLLSDF